MCVLQKLAAMALLALVLASGCNPAPEPPPTQVDAHDIINSAAQAASQAESFRVVIERAGAPVYVDTAATTGLIEFMRAEAQYAAPDRLQAAVKIKIGGLVAQGDFIAIGFDQYLSNPALTGGRWLQFDFVPDLDPAYILAEDGGVATALRSMRDLELVGVERMDGVESYHLRGVGNGADVGSLTLGLIGGEDVEVDAWISTDALRVIRIEVVEPNRPLPNGETEPPAWSVEIYDYDAPAQITAPADFAVAEATAAPTPLLPQSVPGQSSN